MKIVSKRGKGHSLIFDTGLSQYQNTSSKATRPFVTKCHLEPPGLEETKIRLNHTCYMINMATTAIYGKCILKSFSPEPID